MKNSYMNCVQEVFKEVLKPYIVQILIESHH